MFKKALALVGLCGLLAVFSACGGGSKQTVTSVRGGLVTGSFDKTTIPAKDFVPVSLVFAETVINNASSSVMTYDALLKEAHKLGAHAIINVVIEDVKICESDSFKAVCSVTRYGSALAIRYTDALTNDYFIPKMPLPGHHLATKPENAAGVSSTDGNKGGFLGLF